MMVFSRRLVASTLMGISSCVMFSPSDPKRLVKPQYFRRVQSTLCDKSHSKPSSQVAELLYKPDYYSGVIIDHKGLPTTPDEFSAKLNFSLASWKSQGKRGVWLQVPVEKINLAEVAIKAGFVPHHAEKEYIMLTHWLSSEEENHLPAPASHQVGVGVICIREDGKLLVVRERNGPLRGTGFYKIPTGRVEQGEELGDAAVRELAEETGINSQFIGVVAFRHAHKMLFGMSDLFFIVVSKPTTVDITIQESEIEDAQWLELEDYLNQDVMKNSALYQQMQEVIKMVVNNAKSGNDFSDVLRHGTYELGWRPGKQTIYRPKLPSEK